MRRRYIISAAPFPTSRERVENITSLESFENRNESLKWLMGKLRDFLSEHWKDIVTVELVTLAFFLAGKLINYLVF